MKIQNNVIVEFDRADEKHLFIPKDVKAIDFTAFEYHGFFGELESIEVEEGNPVFYVKDNCLMSRDGVLYIAANGAALPADGSVKAIRSFAFDMAESIRGDVRIPEGVEEIGVFAFGGSNIDSVYIPASVKNVSEGFFHQNPEKHIQISVDENNPRYYTQGGCLIERETMTVVAVYGDEITIPEGVKRIGTSTVFFHTFKKIVFPASLEEIAEPNFLMIGTPELLVPEGSYAQKYLISKNAGSLTLIK